MDNLRENQGVDIVQFAEESQEEQTRWSEKSIVQIVRELWCVMSS